MLRALLCDVLGQRMMCHQGLLQRRGPANVTWLLQLPAWLPWSLCPSLLHWKVAVCLTGGHVLVLTGLAHPAVGSDQPYKHRHQPRLLYACMGFGLCHGNQRPCCNASWQGVPCDDLLLYSVADGLQCLDLPGGLHGVPILCTSPCV
jgi:hypothetical protein